MSLNFLQAHFTVLDPDSNGLMFGDLTVALFYFVIFSPFHLIVVLMNFTCIYILIIEIWFKNQAIMYFGCTSTALLSHYIFMSN